MLRILEQLGEYRLAGGKGGLKFCRKKLNWDECFLLCKLCCEGVWLMIADGLGGRASENL